MTGQREVGAAVTMNCYWHLVVGQLVIDGMKPREANELAWRSYYFGAMARYAFQLADHSGMANDPWRQTVYPAGDQCEQGTHLVKIPARGPHLHWTTKCLAAALRSDQELLALPYADLVRKFGPCPRARLSEEDAHRLTWQARMMWLLATGAGDILHCARIAHDRANGRPARKRRPADREWLAAELDTALTAAWDALRNADDGTGRPFWLTPLSPERPIADGGDPAIEAKLTETGVVSVRVLRRPEGPTPAMHGRSRGATKPPAAKRKRRR